MAPLQIYDFILCRSLELTMRKTCSRGAEIAQPKLNRPRICAEHWIEVSGQGAALYLAGLLAHARRKLFDATKLQLHDKTVHSNQAQTMIGKLNRVGPGARDLDPALRHQLRQDQAQPEIDQLQVWRTKPYRRERPRPSWGRRFTTFKSRGRYW